MEGIIYFVIALGLILILDFVWLRIIAFNFYKKQLRFLSKRKYNLFSAGLVYLLLSIGIPLFVTYNLFTISLLSTLLIGGLFGLIVYGVYDLTNLAILNDWKLKITIVDILWGTFLCAIVSSIIYLINI